MAADQHSVRHVGAEETAATLLLFGALGCLPALRLANIAKDCIAQQEPLDGIFAEQQRRAQALSSTDWDDACRKALRHKTDLWSTHPSLHDRLKAIGVSAKKARALLQAKQVGTPARALFPAWRGLEKIMTEAWLDAIRVETQAKRELAQIILGRPV